MSETTAPKPLTEDLLRLAAERLTAGHMTEETAHNLRNGDRTEPIGLLPARSRELARSILDA